MNSIEKAERIEKPAGCNPTERYWYAGRALQKSGYAALRLEEESGTAAALSCDCLDGSQLNS